MPQQHTHTYTHTHTHTFNGPFSRTTQVSQYQKGKTNPDFTEARDSEWQWQQLGYMLQTDNHTSTPSLCFLQAGCPSCRPTNSVKALKASVCLSKEQTITYNCMKALCTWLHCAPSYRLSAVCSSCSRRLSCAWTSCSWDVLSASCSRVSASSTSRRRRTFSSSCRSFTQRSQQPVSHSNRFHTTDSDDNSLFMHLHVHTNIRQPM